MLLSSSVHGRPSVRDRCHVRKDTLLCSKVMTKDLGPQLKSRPHPRDDMEYGAIEDGELEPKARVPYPRSAPSSPSSNSDRSCTPSLLRSRGPECPGAAPSLREPTRAKRNTFPRPQKNLPRRTGRQRPAARPTTRRPRRTRASLNALRHSLRKKHALPR